VAGAIKLDMPLKVESKMRDFGLRIGPQPEQSLEHFRDHIFTAKEEKGRYFDYRDRLARSDIRK
jgi:hypothetical protein